MAKKEFKPIVINKRYLGAWERYKYTHPAHIIGEILVVVMVGLWVYGYSFDKVLAWFGF